MQTNIDWQQVLDDEYMSLIANDTWNLEIAKRKKGNWMQIDVQNQKGRQK